MSTWSAFKKLARQIFLTSYGCECDWFRNPKKLIAAGYVTFPINGNEGEISGETQGETDHSQADALDSELSTLSSSSTTASSPPETTVFNKEKFLTEVQKYRCLWDTKSESYKNRIIKQNAWTKIVEAFDKEGK